MNAGVGRLRDRCRATAKLAAALTFAALLVQGGDAIADAPDDPAAVNPFVSDRIASLVHGVYCADGPIDLEAAPGTAAGVVNIVPDLPEMRAVTTLVPAQIGIGFGVLATPQAGLTLDPVDVTITHPPYPDSGIEVEHWQTRLDGDRTGLVGFSFEVEGELVTGPWRFQASHEGEILFDMRFDVVQPSRLPELTQGCGVAILS